MIKITIQHTIPQKYVSRSSAIHKLDPRLKMVASAALLGFVFGVETYTSLILLCAFVILTITMSSIPFSKYIRSAASVVAISIFTAFANLFFEVETKLVGSNKLIIPISSIESSIFIFMRLFILIFTSLTVMFTTSPDEIARALECLLKPFKYIGLNSQEIAVVITLSLRFIPIFFEESKKIAIAQKARGASFKNKNPIKRLKAFSAILVPLLASSFKKANDLALAMDSRCYDSDRPRTTFKKLSFKRCDIIAVVFIIFVFTGAIICNLKH